MCTHDDMMCTQEKGAIMAGIKGKHNPVDPATNQLKVKLTQEELTMLNKCVKLTGKTKSDVVREGIEEVFKKYQK